MIGFYLLKNNGSTVYVDAPFIKKLLLTGKADESSSTMKNSLGRVLSKIGYIPVEIGENTLIDRIGEYLSSDNIDDFSILLTFNNAHLLSIFYILYSGYGDIEDIYNVIHSTSYFTRRELLLNIISRDTSETSEIRLFGALKSNVSKMFSSKNYNEDYSRRKAAKDIILNGSFEIPDEYIKIPYGANLFAPNDDFEDRYFFENSHHNEDSWSVSRYYYQIADLKDSKIDKIGIDSVSWINSAPYDLEGSEIWAIILSILTLEPKVGAALYDKALYEDLLNPLVSLHGNNYLGDLKANNSNISMSDRLDAMYISKRNVISNAISKSLLQLASRDFIKKNSEYNNDKLTYGIASEIMVNELKDTDFEKNIKDSFALYFAQAQYEYLPESINFKYTDTKMSEKTYTINLIREEYKQKNVYSLYKSISAISGASPDAGDNDLKIGVDRNSIVDIVNNNSDAIDALVYSHDIAGMDKDNILIENLTNIASKNTDDLIGDYISSVKYLSTFLESDNGFHSNNSFASLLCRTTYNENKKLPSSALLSIKKRLLTLSGAEVSNPDAIKVPTIKTSKDRLPGGTDQEKRFNLNILLDFDILVDLKSNIINFGTTKMMAAISEIENSLTDSEKLLDIQLSELSSNKIRSIVIPAVLRFDTSKSEYGQFVSYFAKVIMYKYLLYIADDMLTENDFSNSVMKLGMGSPEFIFYNALYMVRHCYLNIGDVYNAYVNSKCLKSNSTISINDPFGTNKGINIISDKISLFTGYEKYGSTSITLHDVLMALIIRDPKHVAKLIAGLASEDMEKKYFPISTAKKMVSSIKCGVASFKGDTNG